MTQNTCTREYDFSLVLDGVFEVTEELENALFEAGCDDATLSVCYGRIFMEFSRSSTSIADAILSAIRDVQKANIGATVLQVDECNLVTQAEIARRINRSRQLINQYITGHRGPGGFPPPVCQLSEKTPLWQWCAVSFWLCQNDMIKPEDLADSQVVAAINNMLELCREKKRNPTLIRQISNTVNCGCCD